MGDPVDKVASTFGLAGLPSGNRQVMAAGMTAPLVLRSAAPGGRSIGDDLDAKG